MGTRVPLESFILYLLTWTAVAVTPGPAVVYSMSTATRHGLRASLAAIGGIQAGNCVLFAAVSLGLGAIVAASNNALVVLRLAGAAYLCWLGAGVLIRTFTKAALAPPAKTDMDGQSAVRGLLVQVTNPKALLFVTSLLPQFIDTTRSPSLQLTILVATTVIIDALVLSGYAILALRGAQSLRGSRFKTWCERAYGAALLCFSIRLF